MDTVLVIGASGALGSATVRLLLADGCRVRAMSRNPKKRAALAAWGAEAVPGDLRDADALAEACRGVRSAFSAAHSFMGSGRNAPEAVDGQGHRSLIEIAKSAGVQHLVFTSIHGVSPDHPVDFFRVKYGVEAHLKASVLPFTILRPGAFMNTWAETIGRPILKYGMTVIIGKGDAPINFVAAEDVARVAVWALKDDRAKSRTLNIGGPHELSMKQVAMIFEMLAGRPARRLHLPLGLMQSLLWALRPMAPALSRRLAACFSEMANSSAPINMTQTLNLFPFRALSMDEYARTRYLREDPQAFPKRRNTESHLPSIAKSSEWSSIPSFRAPNQQPRATRQEPNHAKL